MRWIVIEIKIIKKIFWSWNDDYKIIIHGQNLSLKLLHVPYNGVPYKLDWLIAKSLNIHKYYYLLLLLPFSISVFSCLFILVWLAAVKLEIVIFGGSGWEWRLVRGFAGFLTVLIGFELFSLSFNFLCPNWHNILFYNLICILALPSLISKDTQDFFLI